MKVSELSAFHVRIPLVRPIRHASHSRDSTDNIIVRATLDDGTQGFGEGVPRDYVTGETIDSALALLRDSSLASQLDDCQSFEQAAVLAERLQLKAVQGDDRRCQGNAARCALELAILDAYGRHFHRSLSEVTRLLSPELYQPREWLRYSGVIASANGLKARVAAWRLKIWRFPEVKVKIGIAGQDDRWRLRVFRGVLGRQRDIRVDVNEAWQPAEVVDRLRELEPFGISAIEQPVPHAALDTLSAVRRASKIPVILDESLCSLVDARRAVELDSCDMFNLRLSKCGGFIPSLRIAEFARQHDIGYQLGCQVGETAVLSAAGRHFAASVGHLRYIEGSYDRYLVRETLARRDITLRWGGWAPALAGPGLGMDVDADALARATVRKERLVV